MKNTDDKAYMTLIMPRDLYERLDNMRWEKRVRSMRGLVNGLLQDGADRYDKERQERQQQLAGAAP